MPVKPAPVCRETDKYKFKKVHVQVINTAPSLTTPTPASPSSSLGTAPPARSRLDQSEHVAEVARSKQKRRESGRCFVHGADEPCKVCLSRLEGLFRYMISLCIQ